jgi:hypothetical protein
MPEYDKFKAVAKDYARRFAFDDYYSALVAAIQTHLKGCNTVLEVGSATGILPEKLELIRNEFDPFTYYSVDPVEEAVAAASKKEIKTFRHVPLIGKLETALQDCSIEELDMLITSRALHEMLLSYDRDKGRLFDHLGNILSKRPRIVVHGIVERYTGLNDEEKERFSKFLEKEIGHGHDTDKDYFDFEEIVRYMQSQGYALEKEAHFIRPCEGFDPSPWRFGMGVFNDNHL